jgi:hypothetical protein
MLVCSVRSLLGSLLLVLGVLAVGLRREGAIQCFATALCAGDIAEAGRQADAAVAADQLLRAIGVEPPS